MRYRLAFPFICIAFLGFAVLLNTASFAQLNSNNLTTFTELDGVPGAVVNKVLVDRFGYIWVGTVNGLARYDGYEFKRYYNNPNDTASIKGLNVWSLFEDHKGQIWIGSAPGFLNVYNPATKSFRQYDFTNLIEHRANVEVGIFAITEDNQGRIYLGVSTNFGEPISAGLLYIDEKEDKVKRYIPSANLEIQNVYALTKDKNGTITMLSYSGLFRIDINRKLSKINPPEKEFTNKTEFGNDVLCDKEGHVWAITNKGRLIDFNPTDSSYKIYTPEGAFTNNFIFNRIVFDKNENIWMGTNNGLLRFNRTLEKFEYFKNQSKIQLEKAAINSLQVDSFGTLWAGSASQGLIKYEEKAVFKSFVFNKDDKNSITQGWVNYIYEAHDGKIWIATSGTPFTSGINELDLQRNTVHGYRVKSIFSDFSSANSFFEDSPGELLLNTNTGTYEFSTKTHLARRITLEGVPDHTIINQFYNDSRENLWLCTMNGLFQKNKGTGLFKRYDLSILHNADAASNEITRAFEGKKHGLWLATNNGLFLYNYATDKIERHGFDKKAGDILIAQDVNTVYEDPEGIVWVGPWQGGLSRYNVETKKIKTFTRDNGLPSMCVQSILADEQNKTLWLSTFDGLSRFDLTTEQFNNFSIADGIQGQLFADGANLKTTNGLFIFGGSNGITLFRTEDIRKNSTPPGVLLTDLKLFNKSIVPGEKSILKDPLYDTKEVILAHDQNNISLEFIAIHYSNPSKNKYTYKLENYDNEWRDVGSQHVAFYPNLPPGNYVFRVKAANNNGVWNEEGARLSIIVKPPWWKTTWAYILYGLLFIVAAFGVDRYFRHRLVQKERDRNRVRELAQAKEIEKAYHSLEQTHETLKATQSQLVQSEKMASLGELTAGIAHEIQNPLNFVNNFSEVNVELIDEMEKEFVAGNKEEGIAIATDVKQNLEKIIHHGKRADAIVKGMLQHSRASTGEKEPTDLNGLVDEYLRLSYHGLRAKNKSFNATIKTDFDPAIGIVNLLPQDIGRVLLNLYNNSFYAVSEKNKQRTPGGFGNDPGQTEENLKPLQGFDNYEPTVTVTTKKIGEKAQIRIRDNGNGIPQKVLEKIFQPFFTTKPTGEGTGLGLSLSYDIIKAHGGEIKVETEEGEGAAFIVELPIK
jgi:signal transduction histidine kinase/ligand-binding sensor domain-containing protein